VVFDRGRRIAFPPALRLRGFIRLSHLASAFVVPEWTHDLASLAGRGDMATRPISDGSECLSFPSADLWAPSVVDFLHRRTDAIRGASRAGHDGRNGSRLGNVDDYLFVQLPAVGHLRATTNPSSHLADDNRKRRDRRMVYRSEALTAFRREARLAVGDFLEQQRSADRRGAQDRRRTAASAAR